MIKNDQVRETLWDAIVAGALLTRLPLPHAPKQAFDRQANSVWAFPLIGVAIGTLMVFVGALAMAVGASAAVAAGLMLATSIIVSGALHEDGLADCADGFWGGYDPERRLEIMKDSQIGTYGVLALGLSMGLRWVAITSLISAGWSGVIVAAVLSRAMMPGLMIALPFARPDGLAHRVGRPSGRSVQISTGLGLVISLIFIGWTGLMAMISALAVAFACRWLAKAKIGGQTGDVLGATQVLSETAVLITLACMIR